MRVFISRDISPDDSLAKALAVHGHSARGWSLVEFEAVPFGRIPIADWVFFYSKNAVKFFFQNIDSERLALPSVSWAAMGDGTAMALEKKLGREPDFVGDGDPIGTASQFLAKARGQKVLFPKARNSRESIARLLGSSLVGIDLVVYDNRPVEKIHLLEDDVLVFTSPMNAETYFSKHKQRPSQRLVAIGRTTADALENLDLKNITVASEPTEAGLVMTLISLT